MTAVLEAATPFEIALPPGRVGLRRAIAAEWTKLWSVRSTTWTLVATGVAVVGLGALLVSTAAEQAAALVSSLPGYAQQAQALQPQLEGLLGPIGIPPESVASTHQ